MSTSSLSILLLLYSTLKSILTLTMLEMDVATVPLILAVTMIGKIVQVTRANGTKIMTSKDALFGDIGQVLVETLRKADAAGVTAMIILNG